MRAVTQSSIADGALPSNHRARLRPPQADPPRFSRFGRQDPGNRGRRSCAKLVPTVAEILGPVPSPRSPNGSSTCSSSSAMRKSAFGTNAGARDRPFRRTGRPRGLRGPIGYRGTRRSSSTPPTGSRKDLVELMARERGLSPSTRRAGPRRETGASGSQSLGKGSFSQLLSAEQLKEIEESLEQGGCRRAEDGDVPTHEEGDRRLDPRDGHRLPAHSGTIRGVGRKLILEARAPSTRSPADRSVTWGVIRNAHPDGSSSRCTVEDTQRGRRPRSCTSAPGLRPRVAPTRSDSPSSPTVDAAIAATVSRRNHTGTHLFLQSALKERPRRPRRTSRAPTSGEDRLRFDFSHPRGVTPEELGAHRASWSTGASGEQSPRCGTTVEDLDEAKARGRGGALRREVRPARARGGRGRLVLDRALRRDARDARPATSAPFTDHCPSRPSRRACGGSRR